MSLLGSVGVAFASSAASSIFGGGGGNGGNVARGFSAECGISPPIPQSTAKWAKTQPNPCAAARMTTTAIQGSSPIPVYPSNPVFTPPIVPPGTGGNVFENILGTVATGVSGTAQASPLGYVARAALTPAMRRKAITFAKSFGIQLAATVFGISLLEMAEIVAKPPRRRRRGITAAQLANARRVNCKVQSMAKSLGMSCTGRAPVRRKTTCR